MTWHPDMPEDYHDQIITGDARELSRLIPDCSIDLIFTDPVYDRIDDYRWLAETAARVLKPDSAALVFSSVQYQGRAQIELEKYLDFTWCISCTLFGATNRLMFYHVFTKWTPLIWMSKGKSKPRKWIVDSKISHRGMTDFPDIGLFKWNKFPEIIMSLVDAFTHPGAVVFDPFTGGGTVPAVCKMLSRHYIAFEIMPEIAELARQRVANTQPPLFVYEPEQMSLEGINADPKN